MSNRIQDKLLRRRAVSKAHSRRWSDFNNAHACTYLQPYATNPTQALSCQYRRSRYSVFASHTCNGIQSVSLPPPEPAPVWLAVTNHNLSLDFMSFLGVYLPACLVRVLPICSYKVWSASPRFVPSRVSQRGKLTAPHPNGSIWPTLCYCRYRLCVWFVTQRHFGGAITHIG